MPDFFDLWFLRCWILPTLKPQWLQTDGQTLGEKWADRDRRREGGKHRNDRFLSYLCVFISLHTPLLVCLLVFDDCRRGAWSSDVYTTAQSVGKTRATLMLLRTPAVPMTDSVWKSVCSSMCVCVCFLSKSEVIRMTNDPESGRARTGVKCPLLFSDVCVNTVRVEPQECQRRAEWCRTGNNRPSNTTCWHKSRSGENLYWMRCLGRKQHRRQNNTRYTLSTKSQRLHLHYMVYPTHCRM